MTKNYWTDNASALADAYIRSSGPVRFNLVTQALLMHLPSTPQRIVDVGGGFGRQAIMLARAGHSVVVVDSDPTMLGIAKEMLVEEEEAVRTRVHLILGEGEGAASFVGSEFDLACCHSVLSYQDDPAPMLFALVDLVHQGGLISILSLNTEAAAMRSGLQGRWQEAAASLLAGTEISGQYAPNRGHSRKDVAAILEVAGAKVKAWYGVGVFTDHLTREGSEDEIADICWLEWLAGSRDPYRQVARCFHIIAERCRCDDLLGMVE